MKQLLNRYRLLAWIGAVLVTGFLVTSIVSYMVSIQTVRESIGDQTLPLTGDTVYSEVQKDVLRPVFISSLMAQDTFVRDWIISGEKDTQNIARYLEEIKRKYGVVSSFLVSEKTRHYYYADGLLKTVREGEPRDAWFFHVRKMEPDYETNVDPDMANRDKITVFINYRVKDFHGNFIAATGVGMTLDTLVHLIDNYQVRFHRNIYFVDQRGNIMLAGKSMESIHESIRTRAGIRDVAEQILNNRTECTKLEYRTDAGLVMLNSRFIPELGWYLVVEQNVSDEIRSAQRVLAFNLAISATITLLVLALILSAVRKSQKRLENVAATDMLTGLINRHAFQLIFSQAVRDAQRSGTPMSAILFDIDHFKQVNDQHGHLAGDQVLREMTRVCGSVIRESDVITRWGGEEFLVLLKGCPLNSAADIAEKLRLAIAGHEFMHEGTLLRLSVSLGVAQYQPGESLDAFFARADAGLYQAKNDGRDKLGISKTTS